jgi:hypothetical protein
MARPQTLEGTREELERYLKQAPETQRFRLIPLTDAEEDRMEEISLSDKALNVPEETIPQKQVSRKRLQGYGMFAHIPGGSEAFALEKQKEIAREDKKFD